jgi:hypothetical protein
MIAVIIFQSFAIGVAVAFLLIFVHEKYSGGTIIMQLMLIAINAVLLWGNVQLFN